MPLKDLCSLLITEMITFFAIHRAETSQTTSDKLHKQTAFRAGKRVPF